MIALISLPQLLTPTSKTAATQAILDVGTALGFDVTSWQNGRAGRTLIAILATIYAAFTVVGVQFAAAGGFLSTATAGWLRLLAQELFGVTWNPANYATGTVTLTNMAAVPYTFSPGGLTLTYSPGSGKPSVSVVNVYDGGAQYGSLPGLATLTANGGTITIPVQALVPGSSTSIPGSASLTLSPSFLGVTAQTTAQIIGTDDETDIALRARSEAKRGALSPNGAAGAYAYWAQSIRLDAFNNPVYPPPVSDQATYDAAVPLDVNRVKVTISSTTGTVNVYLGGSGGAATGGVTATVHQALQTYVVPAGITETTGVSGGAAGCFVVNVPITFSAELDPAFGVTQTDAMAAIVAALNAYYADVQRNPIGGKTKVAGTQAYIFVKVLESVILGALPAAGLPPALIDADISIPSGDVALAPNQLAVLANTPPFAAVICSNPGGVPAVVAQS